MKVLFTSTMRLGDSLHILPIASWFAKTYNTKIDWAIERAYGYKELQQVLQAQPFVSKLFDFKYQPLKKPVWPVNCFGSHRPFHRIGSRLPIANQYDEIFDFGYVENLYLTKKMGSFVEHFAEEHGFGIDEDYKLEYGAPDMTYQRQTVKIDRFYSPLLEDLDGVSLTGKDVFQNLRYAAGAKEVITTRTGAVVLLTYARIPMKIKFFDDDWEWYKQLVHKINGGVEKI